MPSLPRLDGRTVVKAFGRDGWELVRQKGSHMMLVKEGTWRTWHNITCLVGGTAMISEPLQT